MTTYSSSLSSAPLAPPTGRFPLDGSTERPRNDSPSQPGLRPWGLRRARSVGTGRRIPAWRYDERLQLAVDLDGNPLVHSDADPTAETTSIVDGEDGHC